jgi:predicted phage terminase large subunit-like protein
LSSRLAQLGSPALFALSASSRDQHPWRLAPHLAMIDDALLDAAVLGDQRVIINLPPRHGKSESVSRYFPAWLVGSFPHKRVILASYAADIAQTWGAAARDLLLMHGAAFGVDVRTDSGRRGRWEVATHGGGMLATGVAGQITGYGADVFIIDDPIKGPTESQSELQQERLREWYHAVALTRLQPGASMIIVQTRWHEADLTGYLLDTMPGEWRTIILPALAMPDDPLGRAEGEALWPEMFTAEMLTARRRGESDYWWNALYQQAPSPPGGACFHRSWYRHYTITPDGSYLLSKTLDEPSPQPIPMHGLRRFTTVDSAASQRTSADYTAIATWDTTRDGRLFLVDLVHARLETPDAARELRVVFDTHHPMYIAVERDGVGLPLIQLARKDGLPIREFRARGMGDKWTRAQDAVAKMEAGRVAWRSEQHDFEDELASFPYGAHDDMVDALAWAAIHQSQMGSGTTRVSSPARRRLPDPRGAVGRRGV